MSFAQAYVCQSIASVVLRGTRATWSPLQALSCNLLARLRPQGDKSFFLHCASVHTNHAKAAQRVGITASSLESLANKGHGRKTADTTVSVTRSISCNPGEAAEEILVQRQLNMRLRTGTRLFQVLSLIHI